MLTAWSSYWSYKKQNKTKQNHLSPLPQHNHSSATIIPNFQPRKSNMLIFKGMLTLYWMPAFLLQANLIHKFSHYCDSFNYWIGVSVNFWAGGMRTLGSWQVNVLYPVTGCRYNSSQMETQTHLPLPLRAFPHYITYQGHKTAPKWVRKWLHSCSSQFLWPSSPTPFLF